MLPGPLVEAKEPKIIRDSITVLPGPPKSEPVDPGILLQESTTDEQEDAATGGAPDVESMSIQRSSARSNNGTTTSKKFADEDLDKKSGLTRMAKIARNMDPNDEDEPATVQEPINHPTIAAIYGLEIHQMDVVMAFLARELEEEVYMEQPERFKFGSREDDLVCRLRKVTMA